jgi:hypothetical protein
MRTGKLHGPIAQAPHIPVAKKEAAASVQVSH